MNIEINDLTHTINNLDKEYWNSFVMYRIVYTLCINRQRNTVSELYDLGLQNINQEIDISKKDNMLRRLNDIFWYALRNDIIE